MNSVEGLHCHEEPSDPSEYVTRDRLRSLIDANWTTQAIAVAVQLHLPELLSEGPQYLQTLAQRASCQEVSLLRLVRALTSIDIVEERQDGRFGLTETGRLLRADVPGSMAAWAELCGTASWDAWRHLRDCVQTGKSVRRQLGTGGFDHLERNAEAASLFNRAMVGVSRPVALAVASEVDFTGIERVVDVGGGFGELLIAVLLAHPQLHGVLFDMAHAIEVAQARLLEAGLAARCKAVAGNFFEWVPPGADAYMLKSILHDWDDEQCHLLLETCAAAMSPHAKLFIVERVMPEHFSNSPHDRAIARGDLNMLIAQDGRERTLAQYQKLLGDSSLHLLEPLMLSVGFNVLVAGK